MNNAMIVRIGLSAALAWAGVGLALAAEPSSAQLRYERDRAACESGQTGQDRATCLRDAAAAFEEARRGASSDAWPEHSRNAIQRCQALPDAERADCEARVRNERGTTTSGSVEGGGIYRERVTREPAP